MNSGILHGVWIDALDDLGSIQDKINIMLASSPEFGAEEYAVHDYEGFGGYQVSEYENIQTIHEIACFINEYSEISAKLLNHFCGDLIKMQKRPSKKTISVVIPHWPIMHKNSPKSAARSPSIWFFTLITSVWGAIWK